LVVLLAAKLPGLEKGDFTFGQNSFGAVRTILSLKLAC